MKNFLLAVYKFFAGKEVTPPPKHHYDKNEGDEGIDDADIKDKQPMSDAEG